MPSVNQINGEQFKKKSVVFIWSAFRLLLLIGISYVILYPILVKFSLIFMDQIDINDVTVKWVPRNLTLDNLKIVMATMNYLPVVLKSGLISFAVAGLQAAACTLGAYGFARFKFKGRNLLFGLVIATLVIPPQTYVITLYTQFQFFDIFGIYHLITGERGINLLNGVMPFLLLAATGMGIRCGLYVYIIRQSFRALPNELEEAAIVDGAGTFKTFFRIMLPNVIPTVLVSFILSFVWQWNDTFFVNIFASDLNVISQALQKLGFSITSYLGGWQHIRGVYTSVLLNTGALLTMLPLLLLYVVCQKFFVESVERAGLVG